jgi:ferredoxin
MKVMAGRAWLKEELCDACQACIQACHHEALLEGRPASRA